MNDSAKATEPTPDDILGHYFYGGEVHIVFCDHQGGQFLFLPETSERVTGGFLAAGRKWARAEGHPPSGRGGYCDDWKAVHEAGHAVICADEGIKVEYATVVPSHVPGQGKTLGFCRYDYHLPAKLKADPAVWVERFARAMVGGPEAEGYLLERCRASPSRDTLWAWDNDFYQVKMRLLAMDGVNIDDLDYDEAIARLKSPDLVARLDKLRGAVGERLRQSQIWEKVNQIAALLKSEGAIDGERVTRLVQHRTSG
jgi:hypothetical protein